MVNNDINNAFHHLDNLDNITQKNEDDEDEDDVSNDEDTADYHINVHTPDLMIEKMDDQEHRGSSGMNANKKKSKHLQKDSYLDE